MLVTTDLLSFGAQGKYRNESPGFLYKKGKLIEPCQTCLAGCLGNSNCGDEITFYKRILFLKPTQMKYNISFVNAYCKISNRNSPNHRPELYLLPGTSLLAASNLGNYLFYFDLDDNYSGLSSLV
jgi:hypothetical protein